MYEIPQQLEYKEKIVFGLTFRQLAYAFGFALFVLMIFRSGFNITVKIFLSLPFICLAVGFMFFDLENKLKDYYFFIKFRELRIEKQDTKWDKFLKKMKEKLKIKQDEERNQIKKFFEIKEIKDDLIIDSKNNKTAILKVSSINFSIRQENEKDAIIKTFQKFLNSLDFPVQILMLTESIRLNQYLSNLKSKIKLKYFKDLFKDYQKHIQETISNKKIMNRNFYLVIPEKDNLDIQTDICIDRLVGLNLKVKRIKTPQLKRLFSDYLKGSIKGDCGLLFPKVIHNNFDHLNIDGKFHRVICASGYPRYVEKGFLDRIISSLGDFDLSIHIKPYSISKVLLDLNRELQKQRADLYSARIKNQLNPSLEIKYKDTLGTLENLQKGTERLFNVSLYIVCKADGLKELNLLTKRVESELNSLMIIPKTPEFKMAQGYKSISPLGKDYLNFNRNITTSALSAFFPFTSQFLEADNTGIWLGLNKNNIPIIKDIFKLPNPNGLVLAQSGGGKSYFSKLLITRYLLNGTRVMIIDPQGEYKGIVSHFKGQTIDLSKDSDTIINPLDLMGHDYIEKRLSLIDLMKIMLGDLSDVQKALIDKALTKTYESKGITENPDTWNNESPILGDLLKTLKRMKSRATRLEQTTISSISNRLEMYVTGVFSFFNKQTNLDFDNNLVSFDIGKMPSQVKPAVMFLVLDHIYMKMKSDLDRKILLIDEAWTLLSRAEEAGYIFQIVKTCRKFNLGLLLINQEVEGLLDSKAGKSVLANSSYTILMRQKPAVIDNICKTFHLSNNERNHLLTASVGEGLMIMEDDHTKLKVIASPKEHKLITTNPDEKDKENNKNKKPKKKDKVSINVNPDDRFFRKKELNRHEVNFLLDKGYTKAVFKSITSNKKEEFFLQPRHNESLTHLFAVYDIAEYLEKKGFKVEKYATRKPDIVFKKGNKLCAIEVETGSMLSRKKVFEEKVKSLNKNYDEWFFVVTNRNKLKEYGKFGKSLDFRYLKVTLPPLLR